MQEFLESEEVPGCLGGIGCVRRIGQTFQRRVVTDEVALAELADEPYKCELIGLKGGSASAV